jgi:hypothetical protein
MYLQPCLVLLLNAYTLLEMCALLPLMNIIKNLVKYAKARDVYVCNFVDVLHVCLVHFVLVLRMSRGSYSYCYMLLNILSTLMSFLQTITMPPWNTRLAFCYGHGCFLKWYYIFMNE